MFHISEEHVDERALLAALQAGALACDSDEAKPRSDTETTLFLCYASQKALDIRVEESCSQGWKLTDKEERQNEAGKIYTAHLTQAPNPVERIRP